MSPARAAWEQLPLLISLAALAVALWAAGNPRPPATEPVVLRRLDAAERAIGNDRGTLRDHELRLATLEMDALLTPGRHSRP